MKIAIIHYQSGNIQSLLFALERLGYTASVTNDPIEIKAADKLILPGVGHAAKAMKALQDTKLDLLIPGLSQPVLGICLGMQLMGSFSEEGDTSCLGIMNDTVQRFELPAGLKVPHMGWNSLQLPGHLLLEGITSGSFVYYVHSYYMPIGDHTIASSVYGIPFSAMVQKNNFYGIQFHPEKSGAVGELILKNFLEKT